MKLIVFEDNCVVSRNVGVDEYDEPIQEVVYSGVCYYQEGGYSISQSIFTSNPLLFLPDISVLVNTNDIALIRTKFNREFKAIVGRAREVELPITHERITRLELKQATE